MVQNVPFVLLILSFASLFFFSMSFQLELIQVDSDGEYTEFELIQRSVLRSNRRIEYLNARLTNGTDDIKDFIYGIFFEFQTNIEIGTPSVSVPVVFDTASDLLWTECKPCDQCTDDSYDPAASSTFSTLPCTSTACQALDHYTCTPQCQYNYTYINDYTTGVLATETLKIGTQTLPNITFGCSNFTTTTNTTTERYFSSGFIGLSPGPLSFVSQLETPKFSYCLERRGGFLHLGPSASLNDTEATVGLVQTTPFVDLGLDYTPHYYLNLIGISLNGTLLPIPECLFEFVPGELASGTIIDSGSIITYLTPEAYKIVREALLAMINLTVSTDTKPGFDLCFYADVLSPSAFPSVFPEMTLHFDGADMVVPYISNLDWSYLCVMLLPNSVNMTTIGSYQQRGLLVLYDLVEATLSFVRQSSCSLPFGSYQQIM